MSFTVAIAMREHDELVTPKNADYSGFFDLLRLEAVRTQPLTGELTPEALRPFGALLLGVPRQWRKEHEVAAVHEWVARGGALFLLASLGGDTWPEGQRHTESNLFQFAPGVTLDANVLGSVEGHGRDGQYPVWQFQRYVPIDVSALVGAPAVLGYESGCTLDLDHKRPIAPASARELKRGWHFARAAVEVTHAIPVPQGLREAPNPVLEEEFYAFTVGDANPFPEAAGHIFMRLRYGEGTVTIFGAARSLTNEGLARDDTTTFALWLLAQWLPKHTQAELWRRKSRPQRHRLLHGYPMAPLMRAIDPSRRAELLAWETARLRDGADLIVGVLPHPFCNPAVRGCGFCTFPHESFSNAAAREVAACVVDELDAFRTRAPSLAASRVTAVYLGGGTANLTPPDAMEELGAALTRAFDVSDAEVTLEGVPAYFTARRCATLDAFEGAFGARHHRLSMGVQTFDEAQLARMGRLAFGDRATLEGVIREAHARGMTVSCDLLFNLPGQTLDAMLADVDAAVGMGADHVCLYHLVLFEGLGTEWSHDRSLLAETPDNRRACDRWNALRDRLLAAGFVQTSLTNFERADVHASDRAFRYEPSAYAPERHDLLGFGPSAISLQFGSDRALKTLNPDGSREYIAAVRSASPRERAFEYAPRDVRVLYLTRKVVTLRIDRGAYRALFASDPLDDFAAEFEALRVDRLIHVTPTEVTLTPRGMFYADTVAGLFAWRRVHEGRAREALTLRRLPRPRATKLYDANNSDFNVMG